MISFEVHVDQNKYLPVDGRVMNAAVSLTCTVGAGQYGATPTAAQVAIIDISGSMSGHKLSEATNAANAAMLDTASVLIEPHGLVQEFRTSTENVMGESVGDVSLRLWTPDDVEIQLLQQISPAISDLTDRGSPAGPRFMDYPTGQWSTETKIYHLVVEAPPQGAGVQRAAARVSVVAGGQELLEGTVWMQWTNDLRLSTQANPLVAQICGQLEMLKSVQVGLEAREADNIEKATEMLGRAVQLTAQSEDHDTLRVRKRLAEIINAVDGTVRLLRNVDNVQAEMAKLESRKTTVIRRSAGE